MSIDEDKVKEFLRLKGDYLYHREGQELEFKEQFNLGGLAEYFRDFAAFANNRGGYLIFGVKDSPRIPLGMKASSLDQFNKIDPEKISGFLLDIFSPDILWDAAVVDLHGNSFGVFRIRQAQTKPIIAEQDSGREQEIRNGEIYYRYGGRTQRIQHAELGNIIAYRIDQINCQWQDLVQKIGSAGPQNAAILDTKNALIEKADAQILVLDEDLARKLSFVREGEFTETEGTTVLKLVGDVVPVTQVEIEKKVEVNRLARYPLAAMQLAAEVKERLPYVGQSEIWQAIKENGLKKNPAYSVYNFRNKKQEDEYKETEYIPNGIPSIYNHNALEFLLNVFKRE